MTFDIINKQMEDYVRQGEMSGGALIIRKSGKLLFDNMWGYANIEKKIPVTKSTVYRMASVSKAVSAVGVAKLLVSGKIGIDDKISDYLPAFKNPQVVSDERFTPDKFSFDRIPELLETAQKGDVKTISAEREVTIRDLFSHSHGIELGIYGNILSMLMDYKNDDIAARIKRYEKYPLDFQPGTATGYSPRAGFDILSRLAEIISGQPFAEYMQEEVFTPLQMNSTTFHPTKEHYERMARLYQSKNGSLVDVTGIKDIDQLGLIGENYTSASAGLYSTIEDFDRFVSMLSRGGELDGVRILSESIVKQLGTETAYRHLEFSPGMVWGMGMIIRQDPKRAGSPLNEGAFGWSGAYGTHFFVSPKDDVLAAFCMNREDIGGSGSYISKRLEEMIYECNLEI